MIVTLECTEARGEGATPSRYTTQKVGQAAVQAAVQAGSHTLRGGVQQAPAAFGRPGVQQALSRLQC